MCDVRVCLYKNDILQWIDLCLQQRFFIIHIRILNISESIKKQFYNFHFKNALRPTKAKEISFHKLIKHRK